MNCTGCGAGNAEDAAFCAKCGARIGRAPAFCSRCATAVTPGSEFCTKCGKRHAEEDPPRLTPAVAPRAMVPAPPMVVAAGCPRCGAPYTTHITTVAIVVCVVLFPIGLLALLMPRESRCINARCQWRW